MATWRNWQQFTQETSMHGIGIAQDKTTWLVRRILWSFIIVGMVAVLLYACSGLFQDFIRKTVSTKVTYRIAKEMELPTVTLCNQNLYSQERLEADEDYEALKTIFNYLYLRGPKPNWSDPIYQKEVFTDRNVAQVRLGVIANTREDFIERCMIQGNPVNCEDILDIHITDAGVCYQFNRNGSRKTFTAGLNGGIQFLLHANLSDYSSGSLSYSEGFMYLLGEANSLPVMSQNARYLSPGISAKVIVQRKEFDREPPYADNGSAICFDTKTEVNPLHYYKSYSYGACYLECRASHGIGLCGCREFSHPPINGTVSCLLQQLAECMQPASNEFATNPEILAQCNCRPTCKEVQYEGSLSFSKFPSEYYLREVANTPSSRQNAMETTTLNIYYGEMSTVLITEDVTYKFLDLVASYGGTLGVTLGASLLTLLEFIEFFILTLIRKICYRDKDANSTLVIPINADRKTEIDDGDMTVKDY